MIGDELKKTREQAGMTQEQLAFEADVDRTYISELENNKKSPTVEMLFRICGGLGIKASELIAAVEAEQA